MRIAFVRLGCTVDVVIFEDSLDILFQCDCSLVATAITHDEHRRPRPARAGMFLVDDPRGLEREVARLEPAARQVPAISQDHPELVAAMVMERVDAVPPVERLALDRPDQAELETRPHYQIGRAHTSELQSLMRSS